MQTMLQDGTSPEATPSNGSRSAQERSWGYRLVPSNLTQPGELVALSVKMMAAVRNPVAL